MKIFPARKATTVRRSPSRQRHNGSGPPMRPFGMPHWFAASASCGKVDPVFRAERCASEREHRMDPKSGFHFWVRYSNADPKPPG